MTDKEDNRYTFKMEQSDGTVIIVSGNRCHIEEILGDVKSWLLACTFSESLIDHYIHEYREEYNGN